MQRSLREDVERLSTWIKVVNIWAVPVLIALIAAALAWFQRLRTTRAARRGGMSARARTPAMSPKVFLVLAGDHRDRRGRRPWSRC